MTPEQIKQKADELIDRFMQIDKYIMRSDAKQCALFLCDEMIEQVVVIDNCYGVNLDACVEDWQQIKNYINENY